MSEPQIPPAPGKKKGLGPVAWILIGCCGLLLIVALGMGACTFIFAKKVGDFTEDFSDNPARAAAEMVVKFNPDLELVDTDEASETITVLQKSTGEEMTFDWSDIKQGNFKFSSDDGDVEFSASGEAGAQMTITGEDGETTQILGGASADDIPSWIAMPDGATDVKSAYSVRNGDSASGAFAFTSASSLDALVTFYAGTLESDGFEVSQTRHSGGGQEIASVTGNDTSGGRTLNVTATTDDGEIQVTVAYSEGN